MGIIQIHEEENKNHETNINPRKQRRRPFSGLNHFTLQQKKNIYIYINLLLKLELTNPAELRWSLPPIHSDTMLINYKNKGKKRKRKRRTYGITELKATLDNIFTTSRNYTDLHFLGLKESDPIHEMV